MKTGTALVTALFAVASFPILAQQPSPASPTTQQNPTSAEPAPPNSPATTPGTPAVEMSSVNGELVSKLDSKTAKTGDNVVLQTKASVKTADGTEIPKGSKLVGHVIGAQPSGAGTNSQVVLQFDHVELKGGQSMAVHSQIQSISPPEGTASTGSAAMTSGAVSGPSASASPSTSGTNGGSKASSTAPQGASGDPAAGTVVAKTGNIVISTTSIPGVLLANNAPGQQDPRMARASTILLGAKKDIQLDGGTQMVVGLSAAGGGTQ